MSSSSSGISAATSPHASITGDDLFGDFVSPAPQETGSFGGGAEEGGFDADFADFGSFNAESGEMSLMPQQTTVASLPALAPPLPRPAAVAQAGSALPMPSGSVGGSINATADRISQTVGGLVGSERGETRSMKVYDEGGLECIATVVNIGPGSVKLSTSFQNSNSHVMEAFSVKAAVPKYISVEMVRVRPLNSRNPNPR